ncbi:MAG: prolipoprotein diacylglyceryl transferase [Candidatus Kapabacteria bacterium]|jgi:prolipoprotein diacylglyceryl transferase|nr:prolipoprotein diacylglyceryl transferase [Candidatus Kapabacteria bacterium]
MIYWNVDPVIVDLGFLAPRWYGLSWGLAFYLCYLAMKSIFTREKLPLKDLDDLTITVIVATVVGARVGHMVFYDFQDLLADPFSLFAIWKGGLASHGGVLGILLAAAWFFRKHPSYSLMWLLDRLAVVSPIAAVSIRLGNLMNSEIIGMPTDVPWAFVFTKVDMLPRHPAQLYEALAYAAVFAMQWLLYKRSWGAKPGRLFGAMMVAIFTSRFFIEFLKERQVSFEDALPLDMGQILSIPFVVVGLYYLLRKRSSASGAASAPVK